MVCNICGRKFDLIDKLEDYSIVRHPLRYGTKFDGDNLDLHICCGCLEKLASDCIVSPITTVGDAE